MKEFKPNPLCTEKESIKKYFLRNDLEELERCLHYWKDVFIRGRSGEILAIAELRVQLFLKLVKEYNYKDRYQTFEKIYSEYRKFTLEKLDSIK